MVLVGVRYMKDLDQISREKDLAFKVSDLAVKIFKGVSNEGDL